MFDGELNRNPAQGLVKSWQSCQIVIQYLFLHLRKQKLLENFIQ